MSAPQSSPSSTGASADKAQRLMPAWICHYVRWVTKINRFVGRLTMYLIFVMMLILLYSSFSKTFSRPPLWTLEMAQFVMVAYYLLGGPYSMQLQAHVRMDLFYGNWSDRTKGIVDSFTIIFLIIYLVFLLYGGYSSTSYSLQYGERSYSAWRPYMSPIKIIMCIGIFLMLLQAIAEWFKDIAKMLNRAITTHPNELPENTAEANI